MVFKLLCELSNVNYLCTVSFHRYLNNELIKLFGKRVNSFIVFEKGNCRIYLKDKDWKVINQILFNDFLNNPDRIINYHKFIQETTKNYFGFCKKLQKKDFSKLSNQKLAKIFETFYLGHTKNHHSGLLDALLELYGENITNHIKQITKEIAKELKLKIEFSGALSTLTTPLEHSHLNKEKIDLIKIALEVIKNESPDTIAKLIKQHHKRYSWLGYMFIGPALDEKYFLERLRQYINCGEKILEDLKKILNKDKIKERQQQLFKKLKFDEKTKKQIQIAQEILYFKVLRKDSMVHGWYSADSLIGEISNRLGIDKRLVGYLMSHEVKEALLRKRIPELKQRFENSLIDFQDGEEKIILGKDVLKLEKERAEKKKTEIVNQIKGTCAFRGKVKGVVKIVNITEDMKKVSKGDILVSYATNPDLLPAMERAAAFVTDRGGLTCHAAIVARELEKPCLVGTEIATKVLKDGDLVEVDTVNEVVHIIQKKDS